MQSDIAIQTEKIAFAFQKSISKKYNIDFDVMDMADVTATWVDGWCFYQESLGLDENLSYSKRKQLAIQIYADQIIELSETKFTYDHFRNSWDDRMKAIKEYRNALFV